MSYFIKTSLKTNMNDAIEKVMAALKLEGFGVVSQVDMKQTMKTKLDVDFQPYVILGACNPNFAIEALRADSRIGTMLPCNVIVQQLEGKDVEVTAIDSVASMQAVENEKVQDVAAQIRQKLHKVIQSLSRSDFQAWRIRRYGG